MGLTRFRLRVELRDARRWSGSILLLALAGGAALTAAQAARRTDTAFARALVDSRASDAVVNANTYSSDARQVPALRAKGIQLLDAVDRSPLVVAHGRFGGANLYRITGKRVDKRLITGSAFGLVAFDNAIGRTISTLRVETGRPARPERLDEMTINRRTAATTGWKVGTRVTDLRVYDQIDLDPETGGPRLDRGTKLSMRVVGIAEVPDELLHQPSDRDARIFLTPAFARRYPESIFYLNEWVRLRHGRADLAALRETVTKVNRAAPEVSMPIAPTSEGLVKANRANDPLVNGLWILAALAALVGILLAAQSLGRSFSARANDHAQLRALGATPAQRFRLEASTVVIIALVAAVLAAVIAWFLSPLTPVGAARDAEPHPGLSFDLSLSIAAIALIFAATLLAAIPSAWRVSRGRALPGPVASDAIEHRSRVAEAVARAGLDAPAVVGTRLALQPGHGPTATPVRSVLASLALVVAAVTATFAFGVNLERWTTTPQLYGWNWDAAVGTNFGAIPPEFAQGVQQFPHVVRASGLTVEVLTVAHHAIPAIGITPLRGSVAPVIDAGRLPNGPREIVLGAKTMRALHTHLDAVITGTVSDRPVRLTVVGRTTFPALGGVRFSESGLGTGALGTTELFALHDASEPKGHYNYILLRFAPGTAAPTERQLRAALAKQGCGDPSCMLTDGRPAEINGYRSARGLPPTIAAVLVLLIVATMTHVLVSTMRRRAADLAVMRALGCTRRQLVSTLRWQALVLTGCATLIGIPLGLVASRAAWSAFSSQLGIAPGIVWPFATLAAGAISLLALAWLLATAAGLRVPSIVRRHRFAD